jgi:replicative DNA helicase
MQDIIKELWNQEAEKAVLGSMLIKNDSFFEVEGDLKTKDFHYNENKVIFKTVSNMLNNNQMVDLITLSARLSQSNELSLVGGESYLVELTISAPSGSNAGYYAKIIKKHSLERQLDQSSRHILDSIGSGGDITDILEEAEQGIYKISTSGNIDDTTISSEDSARLAFDRIKAMKDGDKRELGVSTGFPTLDSKIGGFNKTDLIILAARPSMGKTSLAMNFAKSIGITKKKKVLFFSLEMSNEQLMVRLMSGDTGIDSRRLQGGNVDEGELVLLDEARIKIANGKLMINDSPYNTISIIKSIARKVKRKGGLDMIIVDYLQLINSSEKGASEYSEVSAVSKGLKQLAKELEIPVLALSQLSRDVEKRGKDAEPKASDLRGSGSIEQDADIIMFIHRNTNNDTGEKEPQTKLKVEKNRNGATGNIYLSFDGATTTFTESVGLDGEGFNKVDDEFDF